MIKAGKQLGFWVITCGNRPHDLGHAHADAYIHADFSDRNAILEVAKREAVSAICPACNDFAALSASWVAQQLGLPGHDPLEVAEIIHHKDRFRAYSLQHGFRVPKAAGVDGMNMEQLEAGLNQTGLPALLKPVDLTGGKGISKISQREDLERAAQKALALSKAGRLVLEEFIEGSRHGYSAFIQRGKVVFGFFDQEYYHLNPYLVAGAFCPVDLPESVCASLKASVERYAAMLNLCDGIFHVQYILKEGIPILIECCRRPPGDLYVELVRHATGIHYAEYLVRAYAGLDCPAITDIQPESGWIRHCIMPSRQGKVSSVNISTSLQSKVADSMMWWKQGERINDLMTHKCGILFLRFDDRNEMEKVLPNIHESIKVEIQ
jgi:biotin carboxylase